MMTDKPLNLDINTVKTIMQQIESLPEMISCEETFRVLDEYVERMADGDPVETLMPEVKYHLDICPKCGHQFELLRDIILQMLDDEAAA